MRFKIFGTKIEVSFLFLALICFMIFIDKSGMVMPMIVSVVLHEVSHLTCMFVLKCQPESIRLVPCGVEIVRGFCLKSVSEILISFSGPFINIFLFIIFFKINIEFALINFCIGFFNLLPLGNLDGGEILKIILLKKVGTEKTNLILRLTSLFFGISGMLIGIILFINKTANLSFIMFSLYLIISVIIKL